MELSADGRERECYLYLIGLRVDSDLELNSHVALMPASCSPNPDDMIDSVMKRGSGSEIDLGVLIATLRLTSSQLRIRGDDERTLAVRAWNAQTDAVLLSALLNCQVHWHIASDASACAFHRAQRVGIMVRAMLLPREIHRLTEEESSWLKQHYSIASSLIGERRFYQAANSLWAYRMNPNSFVQMAVLWAGIEALIGQKGGTRKKIGRAVSFLGEDENCAKEYIKLYEKRSRGVHEGRGSSELEVEQTAGLLHRLIMKSVEKEQLPVVG